MCHYKTIRGLWNAILFPQHFIFLFLFVTNETDIPNIIVVLRQL